MRCFFVARWSFVEDNCSRLIKLSLQSLTRRCRLTKQFSLRLTGVELFIQHKLALAKAVLQSSQSYSIEYSELIGETPLSLSCKRCHFSERLNSRRGSTSARAATPCTTGTIRHGWGNLISFRRQTRPLKLHATSFQKIFHSENTELEAFYGFSNKL